jgi:hypothetical protein
MTSTVTNTLKAAALIVLALAIAAMGIYVAEVDDAPGAAAMSLVLMLGGIVLAVQTARNRLPAWAGWTALAVGVLIAAFAAFLSQAVAATALLFVRAQNVPSVVGAGPSPQYAPAVERARELVRAAVLEQNLPGVSVAVGALSPEALVKEGGTIIWAEGFGWRDVDTRTPMTPSSRFNIGTAASAVPPATIAALGLKNTGAEPAAQWSPEHVGEPEEDFPPFTIIRHTVLQPLGLAPAEYPLPDDRATFYVPRFDDNPRRGRRLMYMRDLACCAGTLASYSTPSDLVRVGLANGSSVDGELAGGTVVSLLALRDRGIVVAVASNIAHANTSALARKIGDAFAKSN